MVSLLINLAILTTFLSPDNIDPSGNLNGTIFEKNSPLTLPGVHVTILEKDLTVSSSKEGIYKFQNISPGIYSVRFSFVGFKTKTVTDVVVSSNRPTTLNIEMQQQRYKADDIVVTSGYFQRNEDGNISKTSLNAEEIRRSPGAGQELTRVITATPGVASDGDMSQDIMVRGGSPRENSYYIDNIFIPGIQHFEEMDGASRGPIGIVNTDLVSNLDFYTGGFSPKYGGRMSSVLDISYKNPNREKKQGNLSMSLVGFGANFETPIMEGKGSWLISARRSYLDLLSDAIDIGGSPRYGDIHSKGIYDINAYNRLTFLYIMGDSQFFYPFEDAIEDGFLSTPTYYNRQNTVGINWRRLSGNSYFSNTAISYSMRSQSFKREFVDDESVEMSFDNRHDYLSIKHISNWKISGQVSAEAGAEALYEKGNFDYYYNPLINDANVVRPEFSRDLTINQATAGIFANITIKPHQILTLNAGARTDYNSVNRNVVISPRSSVQLRLSNRLHIDAFLGLYRQNLPLFLTSQQEAFRDLRDPYSIHSIAGIEYLLGEATQLRIEYFNKQYRNMPIQEENYSDGLPHFVFETQNFYDELTDSGKAFAQGIEFSLQRKLKNGIYGGGNVSLFRSRYKGHSGQWHNRDYDVKTLISIIGGYRVNQKWEFSARWSFIGNRPFTPLDLENSELQNQTIRQHSRYNSERLPAFHSLYIRGDRRFFTSSLSIVTFFELWNSYNRQNIESIYWDRNRQKPNEESYFNIMPVAGFTLKF